MNDRYDAKVRGTVDTLLARMPKVTGKLDLIVEVGSTMHNIGTGEEDLDFITIWTEDFTDLVLCTDGPKATMLRTATGSNRSTSDDIDMQVYSMRRFVNLLVKGNPSILNVLFVPEQMRYFEAGDFPRELLAKAVHTKSTGRAFLGYVDAQLKRWREGRIDSRVNRPELVERYGYDVKYAAHAIRLGLQGQEFIRTGAVTLPMMEPLSGWLREIKSGHVRETDALYWAEKVRAELISALEACTLPDEPDRQALHLFLVKWHIDYM